MNDPQRILATVDGRRARPRMRAPLTGIIPPLITPLVDRDELDVAGLERLLERQLAGGVSGLFVLGTTGEGPSLSGRLRRDLVSRVVGLVKGRVPVLVGITDTAFVESVKLAAHAADTGADGLVLAPPFYMPGGQAELQEYLDHLLPELPLPLFLYHIPVLTKVGFDLDTIRRSMESPRVVGLKDSSGDLPRFRQLCGLLPARPDWTLLIGPEELLADAVVAGGHGGVCGGANLFPELYVALCEAAQACDMERCRQLNAAVLRLGEVLYHIGRYPSSIIKGLKCALDLLGVCDDFMAEPFHRFRADERAVVKRFLDEFIPELEKLKL